MKQPTILSSGNNYGIKQVSVEVIIAINEYLLPYFDKKIKNV